MSPRPSRPRLALASLLSTLARAVGGPGRPAPLTAATAAPALWARESFAAGVVAGRRAAAAETERRVAAALRQWCEDRAVHGVTQERAVAAHREASALVPPGGSAYSTDELLGCVAAGAHADMLGRVRDVLRGIVVTENVTTAAAGETPRRA